MRHIARVLLCCLLVSGAFALKPEPPRGRGPSPGDDLPLITKATSLPSFLSDKKVLSVTEIVNPGQPLIRVFRYTFRGDYDKFAVSLNSKLPGWKVQGKQSRLVILGRDWKTGEVLSQGLVVQPAKLEWSENAVDHTKVLFGEPGWIWVSYSEAYMPWIHSPKRNRGKPA